MFLKINCLGKLLSQDLRILVADPQSSETSGWFEKNVAGSYVILSDRYKGAGVHPYQASAVLKNNADVLLLDGVTVPFFWRIKASPNAGMVLVPLRRFFLSARFLVALFRFLHRRRIQIAGIYRGAGRCWVALEMVDFKTGGKAHRLYMPDDWEEGDLLRILKIAESRHVFFAAPKGGGSALLVDDKGHDALRAAFSRQIGIKPVDIYSVTGEAALFPMGAAQAILERAQPDVADHGRCLPSVLDAFLIEAYYAVYFKGNKSGIPFSAQAGLETATVSGDAVVALEKKAQAAGVETACVKTLEALAAFLDEQGWQPARDTLSLYARKNIWIHHHFFSRDEADAPPGLVVFLAREIAEEWGAIKTIEEELVSAGFYLLEKYTIPKKERVQVGNRIRGGRWGAGAWKKSGGLPACAFVMGDPEPRAKKNRLYRRNSATLKLDNMRIMCKHLIRDKLNKGRPVGERANALHTSDNTVESLDYLAAIFPEDKKNEIYARFLTLVRGKRA